jgi:Flp pilus assembly pilin Flp
MFERIGLRIAAALNGATLRREDGQTLVEYALIIVTIGIGTTGAMIFLREQIVTFLYSTVGSAL